MVEFRRSQTIAYFSDYFAVDPDVLEEYGAFNISLINDLPLFIDPFLLFHSENPEYRALHDKIIEYLVFLRNKSSGAPLEDAAIRSWYRFKEVKQNWLGFSMEGNDGRGLGPKFARALYANLSKHFSDFGKETITRGSHLEKLCLFRERIGKDNISDFTTNLIKEYLLEYTQNFTLENIHPSLRGRFRVPRVRFNYETESWETRSYTLPHLVEMADFVILTPKDMLTKDETWISRKDLVDDFRSIPYAIQDDELRFQVNNYFAKELERISKNKQDNEKTNDEEWAEAVQNTLSQYPEILDWYIKSKEDNGDSATDISKEKVEFSLAFYVKQFQQLIEQLRTSTDFYKTLGTSYTEAMDRVMFMKQVIENQDGYQMLWNGDTQIASERDLQLMFKLTWFATKYSADSEVNNGRGPVDFKISKGKSDATLVEFKLAKNTKLKKNLQGQVETYEKANETQNSIKVVFYFTDDELDRVRGILQELKMEDDKNIVLIDARNNKPSASNV